MDQIEKLANDLEAIKTRNLRVEADKAWETIGFRIFSIAIITYIVASFVLYLLGAANFLLAALVPTAGYILSVQTLPAIKRWWIRKFFHMK